MSSVPTYQNQIIKPSYFSSRIYSYQRKAQSFDSYRVESPKQKSPSVFRPISAENPMQSPCINEVAHLAFSDEPPSLAMRLFRFAPPVPKRLTNMQPYGCMQATSVSSIPPVPLPQDQDHFIGRDTFAVNHPLHAHRNCDDVYKIALIRTPNCFSLERIRTLFDLRKASYFSAWRFSVTDFDFAATPNSLFL